ncbi:MAG: hypothetical protein JWM51_650 [Microbacteriaceae bacterium]|nr:hypothetical protein [Microbacteriaceae bacterium]
MPLEKTVPLLPCRDLEESVAFYVALGFEITYRQARPNPSAALKRGDIDIQLFQMPEFEPELSYGSALILTPDTDALYAAFAAGLRERYGRLPIAGIPRITRPRRKQGIGGGFSVVDPGGNWLRVFRLGDADETPEPERGLQRVLETAARQGDARGNEETAVAALEAGLIRYPDAATVDRVPVLVYRAELDLGTGNTERAATALREVLAMPLTDETRIALRQELSAATEMLETLETPD